MRSAKRSNARLDDLLDRGVVIQRKRPARYHAVRALNLVIGLTATLFVIVLGTHMGLIAFGIDTATAFTRFVSGWANRIDFGLHEVVQMATWKMQVAADETIAALLWVLVAAVLTTLFDRLLLPHEDRRKQRRDAR